jgi:hypothetical protein
MLPFAPVLLIVGSLLCESLLEMYLDAIDFFPMHAYRIKLATVIFWGANSCMGRFVL